MSSGFIKQNRSEDILEMLKDKRNHNAFILLNVIAIRVKRKSGFSFHDLEIGECLLGDHKSYGMSERNYRTAKKRLSKCGFVTFKATTKGTIAKLVDTRIWDVNLENDADKVTIKETEKRRTSDGEVTTNKEAKKERSEEEKAPATPQIDPVKAKQLLLAAFSEQGLTELEQDKIFRRGIAKAFQALQFISRPGFIIKKSFIASIIWACNTEPWLEEGNQQHQLSPRKLVEQYFRDGEPYNGAICQINNEGISFHRGMNIQGAKFSDKTFRSNLSNALHNLGIENPFNIQLKQQKEA